MGITGENKKVEFDEFKKNYIEFSLDSNESADISNISTTSNFYS